MDSILSALLNIQLSGVNWSLVDCIISLQDRRWRREIEWFEGEHVERMWGSSGIQAMEGNAVVMILQLLHYVW